MKIRALDAVNEIRVGDILDALVTDDKQRAVVLDNDQLHARWFYNLTYPRFEIIDDPNQDIIDLANKQDHDFASIAGTHSIQKVYGNKYTLSELKELKELFK